MERSLQQRVGAVVESLGVQRAVMAVIIINAIVLGLETSPSVMEQSGGLLLAIDKLCLVIFVIELSAKLFAQGFSFFKRGWNVFDFLVVGISLVPAAGSLSVLRALRVLRVLRLISAVPSMRRVAEGFLSALPGMGSVFVMMCLIFYVGAVISTKLFGEIFPEWFGTIGSSAYTLFQIMTLESWSMGIVRPVMEVMPLAWLFFIPFILLTTFAVTNLIVGVIVNSMQDAVEEDEVAAEERHEIRDMLVDLHSRLDRIEDRLK